MKHFIHLKDIPAKDLRKILTDAKKRKQKRSKLSTLQIDKDIPLFISVYLSVLIHAKLNLTPGLDDPSPSLS